MKTISQRRCSQCGVVYGQIEVELSESLVNAGLTETHGYCPACAVELEAELEAELRGRDAPVR